MIQGPKYECCKREENRRVTSREQSGPVTRVKEHCMVCDRTHHSIEVPPIHVGLHGASMTGERKGGFLSLVMKLLRKG